MIQHNNLQVLHLTNLFLAWHCDGPNQPLGKDSGVGDDRGREGQKLCTACKGVPCSPSHLALAPAPPPHLLVISHLAHKGPLLPLWSTCAICKLLATLRPVHTIPIFIPSQNGPEGEQIHWHMGPWSREVATSPLLYRGPPKEGKNTT